MTTETETEAPPSKALLILPRLRVQNANTISSPMTWGFPAITAFTGLMTALERRLGRDAGMAFYGVGVVCHGFEPQVTHGGYTRSFHLTRNPVSSDGSTAAIVEEGRAHLDITLVFDVELTGSPLSDSERAQLAARIGELVAGMRIAGGSVMPPLPGSQHRPARAQLRLLPDGDEARLKEFRRLSRRWLPGFALVSRDDLLHTRLAALRERDPQASALDAWLDLSRLNTGPSAAPASMSARVKRPNPSSGRPIGAPAGSCRCRWAMPRCLNCMTQAVWPVPVMGTCRFASSKACIRSGSGSVHTA
jgi:CRISPR-associated protein Csy2